MFRKCYHFSHGKTIISMVVPKCVVKRTNEHKRVVLYHLRKARNFRFCFSYNRSQLKRCCRSVLNVPQTIIPIWVRIPHERLETSAFDLMTTGLQGYFRTASCKT